MTKAPEWRIWSFASIVALAIFVFAAGTMYLLGLFRVPEGDTGTRSLAAALGLVGAVMSSVVTLVGIAIKYSIDDRNARLAVEAEKRNRIEVAIRAVDMLGENNADSTINQIGGALLTLVSLGEVELAVALLAQLWPVGAASAQVAEIVLSKALKTGSEDTQLQAALVLDQNAKQILQPGGYSYWPFSDLKWKTELHRHARELLVKAAATWLIEDITDDPDNLADSHVVLYNALSDPAETVHHTAAVCLRTHIEYLSVTAGMYLDDGSTLRVSDIAEKLATIDSPPWTRLATNFEAAIRSVLPVKKDLSDD